MKACTMANGGVFFIPEKLDGRKNTKSHKIQKAKTSNDNPDKDKKILK